MYVFGRSCEVTKKVLKLPSKAISFKYVYGMGVVVGIWRYVSQLCLRRHATIVIL